MRFNSKFQNLHQNMIYNYNKKDNKILKNQKSVNNIKASKKIANLLFTKNTHEIDSKKLKYKHKKSTIIDPNNLSLEMKKNIFNQNIDLIDKNINTNINEVKLNEIQSLNRKLNLLKTNNNLIQKQISLLKNKNILIEKEKNNQSKNILHQIEKIININEISTLIKIYNNVKLKNSLFERLKIVFLENKGNIIGDDIDNYINWIGEMINKIKIIEKDNVEMNKLSWINKNNNDYKNYYLNICKQFRVKTNTELKKKIIYLINKNNIDKKEEEKMFKLLFKKK